MTIFEAGKTLSASLGKVYDQREATNIASLVMEKLTGFSRSERLVHKHETLNAAQLEKLENYTSALLQHKPVQYVLQEAWFAGMPFYVDENVLIPRPETEELVETVLKNTPALDKKELSILDIGTGSGCIAIAIKKKLPESNVYAMDISEKAITIARKNAAQNETKIEFLKADILNFSSFEQLPNFDIIVSNPPYIMQSESVTMQPNVLQYEPETALFVPDDDALLFYRTIADFSLQHLNKPGMLIFEINELKGEETASLLTSKGFSQVEIRKDLQQKNRIVSGFLR